MKHAVLSADPCTLCPRRCGAPRLAALPGKAAGACRMGSEPVLARAALHHWEEPVISGSRGSGTVFFSGCSLGCVYCQNHEISHGGFGRAVSVGRLRRIYLELASQGAHNINLVNPTHFIPAIAQSLNDPPPVPVAYNSSGYELPESLRLLEGKINVYLPDMKYADNFAAARYSGAGDYFEVAAAAIREMFRQTGPYAIGEDGLIRSGVLIRHLVLPANIRNTLAVIRWVAKTFPKGAVLFSLMGQYTPCGELANYPEINRPLTRREYQRAEDALFASGIEDGFVQSPAAAAKRYIPAFDLSGL